MDRHRSNVLLSEQQEQLKAGKHIIYNTARESAPLNSYTCRLKHTSTAKQNKIVQHQPKEVDNLQSPSP